MIKHVTDRMVTYSSNKNMQQFLYTLMDTMSIQVSSFHFKPFLQVKINYGSFANSICHQQKRMKWVCLELFTLVADQQRSLLTICIDLQTGAKVLHVQEEAKYLRHIQSSVVYMIYIAQLSLTPTLSLFAGVPWEKGCKKDRHYHRKQDITMLYMLTRNPDANNVELAYQHPLTCILHGNDKPRHQVTVNRIHRS